MPSALAEILQDDFSGGSQLDYAPHLIDPRAFFKAIDFLCDDDGSLYERGGSANKSGAAFGATLRFLWDGYLKPGQRTVFANTADFGVLAADDTTVVNLGGTGLSMPEQAAELRGLLFLPGGFIYGGSRKVNSYAAGSVTVTNGSKTVTGSGTLWSANIDAGMLLRVGGTGRVYVVESVDSDTQITLEDAYTGPTVSGSAYTLAPIETATAPYQSSSFYGVCADRLFVAIENKVLFSDLDDPHTFNTAENFHDIPEGGRVVAFGTVGQTLLVFSTSGIWTIDGLGLDITDPVGNPQHRVQQYSADLLAVGSAGIASWQGRLVVPCQDGIWLIDGVSTPTEIGHPVEALWRRYVSLGHKPGGATVFNSHYFLPILDGSGSWVDTLVCRLNRPIESRGKVTFPWTFLSGAGGQVSAFALRSTDTGAPQLLGATNPATARVVDCSYFFQPDGGHKNDADGSTPTRELVTRDYPIDMGTVRKVRVRYELLDAGSDNPTLRLAYSSGAKITGGAVWGSFTWGVDSWAAVDDTDWTAVDGVAPESDGRDPFTFHLNKRLRHIRLRLQSSSPAARLTLRSVELFYRPTRKVR